MLEHTHECDNCGKVSASKEILSIDDMDWGQLLKRIEPGGIVPSGECPDCGALCYLVNELALLRYD